MDFFSSGVRVAHDISNCHKEMKFLYAVGSRGAVAIGAGAMESGFGAVLSGDAFFFLNYD